VRPAATRRRGATALELLVAAGITALVFAVAFPLVGTSLAGSRVLGARYDLTGQLRLLEARLRADLGVAVRGSLVTGAGALELSLVRAPSAPAPGGGAARRVRFEPVRYALRADAQGRRHLYREELDATGAATRSRRLAAAECVGFQVTALGPDPGAPAFVGVRLVLRVPGLRGRDVRQEVRFLQALTPRGR